MSERELREALDKLSVVTLTNTNVAWLSPAFVGHLLSHTIDVFDTAPNALDWRAFDVRRFTLALAQQHQVPAALADCAVRLWTSAVANSIGFDRRLDEQRLCAAQARVLLEHMKTSQGSQRFEYADFVRVWQQCVPNGMQVRDEHLFGVAVVHRSAIAVNDAVQYLPVESLADTIEARWVVFALLNTCDKCSLSALFAVRKQWPQPELIAFVADLAASADERQVTALLTRHCRSTMMPGGMRMYNAK